MSRPSAAVAALEAYLRQQEPGFEVVARYAYMSLAKQIGQQMYSFVSERCYELGELLYLPLLYPDKRPDVVASIAARVARDAGALGPDSFAREAGWDGIAAWEDIADRLLAHVAVHASDVAAELGHGYDVVGLTTCFGQMFANLALAAAIKQRSPHMVTICGGSSVSHRIGPALLREYEALDFVIQGEGETPLLALLRACAAGGSADTIAGVLSRTNVERFPKGAALSEVERLDELPIPSYDGYADAAAALGISWSIPIEGSRGCWWDRAHKTSDPRHTCYFCNLNVQWKQYREKSEDRVVRELDTLTTRYASGDVFFLDNVLRHRGVERLARGIIDLGKDLRIFYEMRVNVRPHQLLLLWEAGVRDVQFGIEALSTSLLERVGKGTTTIQNFEAMKTCYELDIANHANLITGFPTTTEAEIEETRRNIELYAICWQPLSLSEFSLGVGSTVETLRSEFGVTNVRNHDSHAAGLPEGARRRLNLMDLSFDLTTPKADWTPVRAAQREWQARHDELIRRGARRRGALLEYEDGGSFLRIRDRRDRPMDHVLRGPARDVYLHCTEIRTASAVVQRFAGDNSHDRALLEGFLQDMLDKRVMFQEGDKILALAIAPDARSAARRIRLMHPDGTNRNALRANE